MTPRTRRQRAWSRAERTQAQGQGQALSALVSEQPSPATRSVTCPPLRHPGPAGCKMEKHLLSWSLGPIGED